MEKLLLTPEEASEALSIGRSKLYELLADGTLESVVIGACRRVPRAAIEQFVDRLRTSQSEEHPTPEVSMLRKQRVSAR